MNHDLSGSTVPGGHTSGTAIAAIAVALVVLPTLAAFLGLLPPAAGFNVFLLGAVLGIPALGWAVRRDGILARSTGLALIPVAALFTLVMAAAPHPVIRDVSTDPTDPPVASAPGISPDVRTPHLQRVRSALGAAHPDLTGRVFPSTHAAALVGKVQALLTAHGWQVEELATVPREKLLHAVVTSRLFRFQDDVLVRLRNEPDGSVRIDVRSASRLGKSDLGANAARIEALLSELDRWPGAARP